MFVIRLAALAAMLAAARLAGAGGPEHAEEVRRVLTLIRGAGEEYREALDDAGKVVRPLEIEEARLFLDEAGDHVRRLATVAPPDLGRRLDGLRGAIDAGTALASVDSEVDALCRALSEATGVREEMLPPERTSPARGAAVFQTNCVSCHGATGAGDGPEAARLDRAPANFRDPGFMRGETPSDFFSVISIGKRRAQMPAWDAVLSVQERWDAVSYLFSLAASPGEMNEGQGIYLSQCASCHGEMADGRGPYAAHLGSAVPDLSAPGALAGRTDADLFAAVTDGVPGTAMPAFRESLGDAQRWKAVGFLRRLSLGGVGQGEAVVAARTTPERDVGPVFADVRQLVARAADAYRRNDPAAVDLASDAYMRFEPLEPALGARDASLVRRVEEAFLALRGGLRRPGADVAALVAAIDAALARAEGALASRADAWARFVQSAAIILREGFEVVLILGALLAWVVKSGTARMKRPIYAGALAGVVASLATAVVLSTVFRLAPGTSEALEGAAMLLAAAVLFWVSYWIVSKAEAERWQRYIRGKVERAVAAGSGTALAAAAFLAVYREGFETVLFYQALFASAPAGDLAIGAGFVAGAALLAVVYLGLARLGVRIPIRQFFLATGALLIVMAISFAGKGVHELQEAGVVPVTPLAWMPQIELIGVFPTRESVLAQAVMLALVVYAAWVTLHHRRPALAEVRPLEKRALPGNRRA